MNWRAPLMLMVLLACACAGPSLKSGVYDDGVVHYKVAGPGPEWSTVDIEGANAAWFNDESAAALLVNSHCEGVQDAPLEALTKHLTIGMTDREVVKVRRFEVSRREALETEMNARMDGVERRLIILVVKKDGCVYDIVLDSHPSTIDRSRPGYERVRDAFDVGKRRDQG